MERNIIHLYVVSECGKKCPMCCNKLYDIDAVPVVTVAELKSANTVCLTGGDPFLYNELYKFIGRLRGQYPNIKNLYAYTSGYALYNYLNLNWFEIGKLDGVSIAPKDVSDWISLRNTLKNKVFNNILSSKKSNRLMIFDNQKANFEKFLKDTDLSMFTILGRTWDKEFNTPENEIFRRLPILFDGI